MNAGILALGWAVSLVLQGAVPGHALRVVPPEMDVSSVIDTIETGGLPVELLVIDVCRSGQALFAPPEGSPFVARQGFEDGTRLRGWIAQAHAAGMRVYAGMNLLRWWEPGSPDPDPFEAHPELLELDSNLGCDTGTMGKYASPWSREVRDAVKGLLQKLATDYSELDGLYVECRLSMISPLGFSDAARAASIRALSIDPIDVPVYGVSIHDDARLKTWFEWRLTSFREIVSEFRQAFRGASGGKPFLARVTCGVGAWSLRYKAASCQDWMEWRFYSAVDDLVLEIDLTRGVNAPVNEFNAGYRLYQTIQPPGQPYLLVPGELGGQPVSIQESAERMDKWRLPTLPLFLDPARPEQLEPALGILAVLRDNKR